MYWSTGDDVQTESTSEHSHEQNRGSFSRTLLEHRLVDEYLFWLFPVIAGSGERLYDGIDFRSQNVLFQQLADHGERADTWP